MAASQTILAPENQNGVTGFLKELSRKLGSQDFKVFAIVLVSALVIFSARAIAPFEIGKDLAVQLEASQRLVDGLGLTTPYFALPQPHDLAQPPEAGYLTWWPPAFSLLMAAFLMLGFPLLVSLKIVYGAATIIGWVGWAILASHLLSKPIRLGSKDYRLGYMIALLAPVFTTPTYEGTDIFLWAAIPVIVLLLIRSKTRQSPLFYVIAAGLLFGFCSSVRYASLFVGLGALLILFQINYPSLKAFLKNSFCFSFAASIFIVSTFCYVSLYSQNDSGLPELFRPESALTNTGGALFHILRKSPVLSYLVVGMPLIERSVNWIGSVLLKYAVGLACFVAVFSIPIILFKNAVSNGKRPQEDLALSLSLLAPSLVVFLIMARLLSDHGLFGIGRYYEPLSFCGIILVYFIASGAGFDKRIRAVATALIFVFIAYLAVYLPATGLIPKWRAELVQSVLSYRPSEDNWRTSTSMKIDYPGFQVYSLKENSREKLRQLYKAFPDATFFLSNYAFFMYEYSIFKEEGLERADVRRLPKKSFWDNAYSSKPLKVFWVLDTETPDDFLPVSESNLIHQDRFEKTKIFESDFPAGYRFSGGANH